VKGTDRPDDDDSLP